MNKVLLAAAGLVTGAGLAGLLPGGQSHAQQAGNVRPDPITVPIGQPPPAIPQALLPTTQGYQQPPPQPNSNPFTNAMPPAAKDKTSALREYLSRDFDAPDPIAALAVKPEFGNWMVCVHWYSGKDAAAMAEEMVKELKNNPDYKLKAYVFRKGVEECKAEQQKIRQHVLQEQDRLAKQQLAADTTIRVPFHPYEIQYAVLVGGYKDRDSAYRDLVDRLKKLKPLDPKKVKLSYELLVEKDVEKFVPVNPFRHGMVVPNPSIAAQRPKGGYTADDLALLRELNTGELFSLLDCKKKYTLVVRDFPMGVRIESQSSAGNIFGKASSSAQTNQGDWAGTSATALAAFLRGKKCEAWVLHMRHCSYVTVGSYDSPDDPRMKHDKESLPRFNELLPEHVRLLAAPLPMAVPK